MDFSPAEHHRAGQRRQPGRHVHDRPAGEIEHAHAVQKPVRVPRPVREGAIDEDAEQAQEEEIARKAHPFGKRSGDQRRRDDGELELKQREDHQGDRGRQIRMCGHADMGEHEVGGRTPDDAMEAVAEGEAEPHDDPQDADHRHGHKALKHRRHDVPRADHPPVEEGQAGRHQEDERGGRQHPRDVAGVHRTTDDCLRRSAEEPTCQARGRQEKERQC